MSFKELLAKLKDGEVDADKLESQIESIVKATVEEATKQLKKKNEDLLDELKEAKGDRKRILDALGDAAKDPDTIKSQLERLEELEREQAEKDGNTQKQIELATKKHERELERLKAEHKTALETLQKELQEERGFTEELLVDNGLTEQLTAAGVPPKFIKAARALLKPQAQVERDGTKRKAVIKGEDGDAIDLKGFVAKWVESDEGKHFVEAPDTGGGGGGHTSGKPPAKKNPWAKGQENLTDQMSMLRTDRAKAERLAREAGVELPQPLA